MRVPILIVNVVLMVFMAIAAIVVDSKVTAPWPRYLLLSITVGNVAAQLTLWILGALLRISEPGGGHLAQTPAQVERIPTWLSGVVIGIVERTFFAAVVGLSGAGSASSAAMLWIGLKAQTHYNVIQSGSTPVPRRDAYLAIIAGLVSMLFAFYYGNEIYKIDQ